MVSPRTCPGNTDQESSRPNVELSDVVRRFGREYRSQYGHRMLPSHNRALTDIETDEGVSTSAGHHRRGGGKLAPLPGAGLVSRRAGGSLHTALRL